MKLHKAKFAVSFAVLLVYVAYLHLKIHALNRLVLDECAGRAAFYIELYRMVQSNDTKKAKGTLESFLENDWMSFHEGVAKNHAGRELWKYKIGKTLFLAGAAPVQVNPELKDFVEGIEDREKPDGDVEFYQAWDNPMLNWWPRW